MKKATLQTRLIALCALAALAVPMSAQAHRSWLLPSGTIFSGQQPWVTVDAASSNDIFYFEHNASSLDNLVIVSPDGQYAKAENAAKTRYRSVFDLKLEQQGTYRIALVNSGLIASFKVNGESKRLRGSAETLQKDIPANAEDLRISQNKSRIETFVTRGKPTIQNIAPANEGIELVPVTHPNDLVAGEVAVFKFVDDGKPAAGYDATVILAGSRYRDQLDEVRLTTDENGEIKVTWPEAGMYWINVSPKRPATPNAGPVGTLKDPVKRSGYSLTVEVLPG